MTDVFLTVDSSLLIIRGGFQNIPNHKSQELFGGFRHGKTSEQPWAQREEQRKE